MEFIIKDNWFIIYIYIEIYMYFMYWYKGMELYYYWIYILVFCYIQYSEFVLFNVYIFVIILYKGYFGNYFKFEFFFLNLYYMYF